MGKRNSAYSFSVSILMLVKGSKNIIKMNTFLRNTISELYDAFSASVTSTRDALANTQQSVRGTIYLLYQKTKEKLGYGQTWKMNQRKKKSRFFWVYLFYSSVCTIGSAYLVLLFVLIIKFMVYLWRLCKYYLIYSTSLWCIVIIIIILVMEERVVCFHNQQI